MKITQLIATFLIALISLVMLQSCGRKGPLTLPADVQKQKEIDDAKYEADIEREMYE